MLERCRRICGDIGNCFIGNNKQVECIADMVVNKVFGVKSLIEMTLSARGRGDIEGNLEEAIKSLNELTNWVKFLQIAADLRMLSSLFLEKESDEKRKEIRYPLPDEYQKHLGLLVKGSSGWREGILVNFSQHGLRFKLGEELAQNSVYECELSTLHSISKQVFFKAKIKYRAKVGGGYIFGAEIGGIEDAASFNFFENVYDFITEISKEKS